MFSEAEFVFQEEDINYESFSISLEMLYSTNECLIFGGNLEGSTLGRVRLVDVLSLISYVHYVCLLEYLFPKITKMEGYFCVHMYGGVYCGLVYVSLYFNPKKKKMVRM